MKKPDEMIKCPNSACGMIMSRKQYEAECCWRCGEIRPLPKRPVVFRSSGNVDTIEEQPVFDESKVKKMSDY